MPSFLKVVYVVVPITLSLIQVRAHLMELSATTTTINKDLIYTQSYGYGKIISATRLHKSAEISVFKEHIWLKIKSAIYTSIGKLQFTIGLSQC